jgi:hypothetical protein
VLIRRFFVVVALLAAAGCAIEGQDAPGLTGPSELSLSLGLTATPDFIKTDSFSTVVATALSVDGAPLAGIGLRLRVFNGGGTLSATSGTTDGAGRLTVIYTPPGGETLATIEVTPIADNAQNQRVLTVTISVRN